MSVFDYVRRAAGVSAFEEATAGSLQKAIVMKKDEFIIVSSYSRTGTSSLQAALNILGIKCYHARDALKFNDFHIWAPLVQTKRQQPTQTECLFSHKLIEYNWNILFKERDFSACSDAQGVVFYKELMQFYPNYKVIHCQREGASWHRSSMATNFKIYLILTHRWLWRNIIKRFDYHTYFTEYCALMFGGVNKLEDKMYQIERYNEWNKEVMRHVPHDRLLLFDINKGWKPLCKFLQIDTLPDQSFPHSNDRSVLTRVVRRMSLIADVVDAVV
eukprot:1015242_1